MGALPYTHLNAYTSSHRARTVAQGLHGPAVVTAPRRTCGAVQRSVALIDGPDREVSAEQYTPARRPGDVPLIGFNDIPFAADPSPTLTTVRVPYEDPGLTAVRLALKHEERPGGDDHVVLSTQLVIRQSVRPPSRARTPVAQGKGQRPPRTAPDSAGELLHRRTALRRPARQSPAPTREFDEAPPPRRAEGASRSTVPDY